MGGCNIQQRDGLKWIGFQDFAEIAHNLRDVLAGRPGTLLTYYVQGRLWQSPLAPQQLLRELGLRPKQVVRQLALDIWGASQMMLTYVRAPRTSCCRTPMRSLACFGKATQPGNGSMVKGMLVSSKFKNSGVLPTNLVFT